MNTKLISAAALTASAALLPLSGHAFSNFTDNAANSAYASAYAGNGAGTPGFGAFSVATTTTGGGAAGTFIGSASATENGTVGGALDTSGKSFGIYANGTSGSATDPSSTVTRAFNTGTSGLKSSGEAFSLDFITGYNDGAPGSAGVGLTNGSGSVGSFVYQSNGANSGYYFNGTAIGQGYKNGILHLAYTLTSATTYSFASTGAITYSSTGTYASPITGFQVQQVNSANGGGDHDAFFNNLSLTSAPAVPEASSSIGLGLMLALGGLVLVAKKRSAKA